MTLEPDLARRRHTHFVLWRPASVEPKTALVIGRFADGNPPTLAGERTLSLSRDAVHADLWTIALADCNLEPGVHHYFFEVADGRPGHAGTPVRCTDPAAWTVDWRLIALVGEVPYPAAVVM